MEAEAHPSRFGVLGAYCASSFLCAGAWNTLSPIYGVAEARFGVDAGAVTLVALSLFLTYVPGSLAALYVTERYGLRATLLLGATCQTAMCLLKWVGVALVASPHGAYALVLAGQLVGGLGQPLVLNTVARLTQDWFPVHERDVATVVGYQASNAGAMLFNALPAWLVKRPRDLSPLFLAQLALWVPVLLATGRLMPSDRPPSPPSAAAALQWAQREAARASLPPGAHAGAAALSSLLGDLRALAAHRSFRLLALGFSLTAGMSWALPTVEGQLICACGYSSRVAGGAGAALLAAGVACCAALAPLLRRPHAYLPLQRNLMLAAAAAAALLLAANRPLVAPLLVGAWALFGAAQGPLGPVTLAHAAELTYPLPADSSSAFLFIASNLVSFAQVSALQPLLARPVSARCAAAATPAAALVLASMLAGAAAVFAMRPEQPAGCDAATGAALGGDFAAEDAVDAPMLTQAQRAAANNQLQQTPLS